MVKKLKALFNTVIVKPIEQEDKNYGGIIVPDIDKQSNEIGEIVAVGPGMKTITGEFIPTTTHVGDVVVMPTLGFSKMVFEGTTYYLGRENELLSVIEED
jgi:chaperonin GroES